MTQDERVSLVLIYKISLGCTNQMKEIEGLEVSVQNTDPRRYDGKNP